MRRTGFARPAPRVKQYEGGPVPARAPVAVGAYLPAAARAPIPKHQYIRSEKLMVAYRSLACQHCGTDNGSVCGAHSNWGRHGKGKQIKADDNRAASLCFTCHTELDQGSYLTDEEKKALWWPAHVKTVALLVSLGRWPAGVPVPDTAENPWEVTA